MTHHHLITIEKALPLSQSRLWEYRTAYYQQHGMHAWSGDPPFFIASNPYSAYCYARLIISYIRDCLRSGSNRCQPFYIMELGAGCGQFGFYCVKQLLKLKQQLRLDVDICYIMSDFVEENLTFWQQQAVLQPLFKAGILDCARYDLEKPQVIKLCQRGHLLTEQEVTNPLTVIANYVTHSTLQDSFRSFTLPVGMFRCLDSLRQLSNNQLMLLATDRAYPDMTEFSAAVDPAPVFHDNNFSFAANFHAIGEYFRQQGGRVFQQQPRGKCEEVIAQTAVFILVDAPDQLADTLLAIDDRLHQLSPMDYFSIHHLIRRSKFDFHSGLTELSLCDWDPHVLLSYAKLIEAILPKAGEIIIAEFVAGMEQAASHIYPLPAMPDYYFIIARVYHIGQQYEKATAFYQQSLQLAMAQEDSMQRFRGQLYLGRCYEATTQYSLALTALRAAEALQPDSEEVKSDLERVQKQLFQS